jgi:SAM-dependent methyltransferase
MLSSAKRRIGRALKRVFELYFDWQLGVRTRARTLPAASVDYDDANELQPLSYFCLWKLRRHIRGQAAANRIDLNGELVDFGCGNGRAVAFLKRTPFKTAVGIEIDPGFCAIARNNLAALEECTVLQSDAAVYAPTGREAVLFFFNPFGVKTLRAVLAKSYPPNIAIYYVKPGEEQLALFRERFPNARIQIEHWNPDTAIVRA